MFVCTRGTRGVAAVTVILLLTADLTTWLSRGGTPSGEREQPLCTKTTIQTRGDLHTSCNRIILWRCICYNSWTRVHERLSLLPHIQLHVGPTGAKLITPSTLYRILVR